MSQVNVINVIAHNAKAPFLSPLSFEIFFEALMPLKHSKSTANTNAETHTLCVCRYSL